MESLYSKIKIVHVPSEKEPFVVIDKPRGLASAPLAPGDASALTWVAEKFPETKNVCGKKAIEYGLVHRIDTETRGLLLVALTQEFYDRLIEEQTNGRFVKHYMAVCNFLGGQNMDDGFPTVSLEGQNFLNSIKNDSNSGEFSLEITSRFRPFGLKNKEVRPVNEFSGRAAEKKAGAKTYRTMVKVAKESDGYKAECRITEGYRHQVRCHLAWLGLPIKGDPVYGLSSKDGTSRAPFMFTASGLEFLGFDFSIC